MKKDVLKNVLIRRFDISRIELDRLICRHGAVALRTPSESVAGLIERLAPVSCAKQVLVRLGASGDGGYMVPNDLDGIEACFSPGVDRVSQFEMDCASRGMDVFMADKSVSGPANQHERFHFVKMFVGAITNNDYITMDDWVEQSVANQDSDLLLQMDIEGAEYEVLLRMSDRLLKRFRIVVVEFHRLDALWDEHFFMFASKALQKMLLYHRCVHIHPNNSAVVSKRAGLDIPGIMEFTFLRKDRISSHIPATAFPHPLDANCTSFKPTVTLPACWQRRPVGAYDPC